MSRSMQISVTEDLDFESEIQSQPTQIFVTNWAVKKASRNFKGGFFVFPQNTEEIEATIDSGKTLNNEQLALKIH